MKSEHTNFFLLKPYFHSIRYPAVAGKFYPADKSALKESISGCFRHELGPGEIGSSDDKRMIKGALVPHAGYSCSGMNAAHAYRKIAEDGLQEDFLLLGASENPYPYFAQTDIYVHATGFEGKSIAIQEAQVLGCAIVGSEINWEQINQDVDGLLCVLDAKAIMEAVLDLIENPDKRKRLGEAALQKTVSFTEDIQLLDQLLDGEQ